jgi:hypothetical protein
VLVWLADVLRAEGLHVYEVPGWKTRQTRPGFAPVGVVWHHTATGTNWSNQNVRQLLTAGRSDLSGPLSQLGLERDGTFVVIAAGRCNHNGFGQWGNDSVGIEAYNDGKGEPWPAVQVDAYVRGTAAICRRSGWDQTRVLGHKETDPDRKVDPAGLDMDAMRRRVAAALRPESKGLFMHLTEAEEREILTHLRHLDPWPPEKLNSIGKKDPNGKPAARHLRWIAESLDRLRRL